MSKEVQPEQSFSRFASTVKEWTSTAEFPERGPPLVPVRAPQRCARRAQRHGRAHKPFAQLRRLSPRNGRSLDQPTSEFQLVSGIVVHKARRDSSTTNTKP